MHHRHRTSESGRHKTITIMRAPLKKINQNPIKKLRMKRGGQATAIGIDLSAFMTDSCHKIFSPYGRWSETESIGEIVYVAPQRADAQKAFSN